MTTVTVSCDADREPTAASTRISRSGAPVVTVSASVPYPTLLGIAGDRGSDTSAQRGEPVGGVRRMTVPAPSAPTAAARARRNSRWSCPLLPVLLLGLIDAGRFMWEYNQAEKATQMGVRYAVSTDLVPAGIERLQLRHPGRADGRYSRAEQQQRIPAVLVRERQLQQQQLHLLPAPPMCAADRLQQYRLHQYRRPHAGDVPDGHRQQCAGRISQCRAWLCGRSQRSRCGTDGDRTVDRHDLPAR